jgi:hypothetical protein
VTLIPLQELPKHAISRVTVDLAETRSYLVFVGCLCGASFPDVPAADFSGVLDVALQVFFTHLAALP